MGFDSLSLTTPKMHGFRFPQPRGPKVYGFYSPQPCDPKISDLIPLILVTPQAYGFLFPCPFNPKNKWVCFRLATPKMYGFGFPRSCNPKNKWVLVFSALQSQKHVWLLFPLPLQPSKCMSFTSFRLPTPNMSGFRFSRPCNPKNKWVSLYSA